jgi:hypothetical protein
MSIIGKRFERLLVIKKDQLKKKHYICECDCGNIKSIAGNNLYNFSTLSCGCYLNERRKKHGDSKIRFYGIWKNMIHRGSGHYFENYQGVIVCERWKKYENFKEDMYTSYIEHFNQFGKIDTSIERIDNNGNYEPENCKWATKLDQCNNRKSNKYFEAEYIIPGESFGYKEISKHQKLFAEKYRLSAQCIYGCLHGKQKTHFGWVFKWVENQT